VSYWNSGSGIPQVDGVSVGTNSGMTLNPSSLGSTVNNYIGKSQYADPYLDGSLGDFRIYSVGLSAAEIAATAASGPEQLLSTNRPPIEMTVTGTSLTLSWPLACAGFTVQSSTNLASGNWVTISSPAPLMIGTNYQLTLQATNPEQFFRLSKEL